MGRTRFMVLPLRQLIKMGAIAIIGLVFIILLVVFLLPKKPEGAAVYSPGTYTAMIVLQDKPVNVDVTVSAYEIVDIALVNLDTEQELLYPLFRPMMAELSRDVIRFQSTKLKTNHETAVTSRILLDAIDAAVAQAVL